MYLICNIKHILREKWVVVTFVDIHRSFYGKNSQFVGKVLNFVVIFMYHNSICGHFILPRGKFL